MNSPRPFIALSLSALRRDGAFAASPNKTVVGIVQDKGVRWFCLPTS